METFRWDATTGIEGLGDLAGGRACFSEALGASADGAVIVGRGTSTQVLGAEAFRWEQATGMVGLGYLSSLVRESRALATSADGSVVVGEAASTDEGFTNTQAFRWTLTGGMEGLGDLPGGNVYSRANGVSADGTVVVGGTGGPSFADSEAFRWTPTGDMESLGIPQSTAVDVSADGSVVVGTNVHQPPSEPLGTEAFRWDAVRGRIGLGDLPGGGFDSVANAASADGTIVVGSGAISGSRGRSAAFVWDEQRGIRDLWVVLQSLGLDLSTWALDRATGVSDDGLTIVGSGRRGFYSGGNFVPSGDVEAWIAQLPLPAPECTATCGNGVRECQEECDLGSHNCSQLCLCDSSEGTDRDLDAVDDGCDNCVATFNPDQRNGDGLGGGDLCDPCPADASDSCESSKSSAETLGVGGGTLCTPDDDVCIEIPMGALNEPTSVSITGGLGFTDSTYCVGRDCVAEPPVALFELLPGGITFDPPAVVTLGWDDDDDDGAVDGEEASEAALKIFREGVPLFADENFDYANRALTCAEHDATDCVLPDPGNGVLDSCCDPDLPEPANQWSFEVSHFSELALVQECVPADARRRLVLSRLDTPPGDDVLRFRGKANLPAVTLDLLDPLTAGLRLVLTDPVGSVLDVALPSGAFDPTTRSGWRLSSQGTRWTYRNRSDSPSGGIVKVTIRTSARTPDTKRFFFSGRGGSYEATEGVEARIVLIDSGSCVAARFPGPPPSPTCKSKRGGSRLVCGR